MRDEKDLELLLVECEEQFVDVGRGVVEAEVGLVEVVGREDLGGE